MEIFSINAEGFGSGEKVLRGRGDIERYEKKWDGDLWDMESKCQDLLLEEHCKKLFYLMNCFWEAFVDVDIDISWLVKVRNHLDKIDKEQAKTKQKKLARLSRNSHLKRMVLERFDEPPLPPIFNLSWTFFRREGVLLLRLVKMISI